MLTTMRPSIIWFSLGVLWTVDGTFALVRHDRRQALAAAVAAVIFLGLGLYFRRNDEGSHRP